VYQQGKSNGEFLFIQQLQNGDNSGTATAATVNKVDNRGQQ